MLKIKTTPNLYGVTLMGDYEDLNELYDSISRYLRFYQDNNERLLPYHEYEYLLALNYDIRHCYQGDRGYEAVDNNSENYGAMAGIMFGIPEKAKQELQKIQKKFQNGNLYYTVEILYPLIFHYMITFETMLERDILDSWFETENEIGKKWEESYTVFDAMRDKAQIAQLTALFWENLQELMGKEKCRAVYNYYMEICIPIIPSSLYCDALIRCELVNFEEMSREEKLAFHLASVYEIIGVSDWEDIPEYLESSEEDYRSAIGLLNGNGGNRFPVGNRFFDALDQAAASERLRYREDFDRLLDEMYGEDPDPFETGEFRW